MAEGDEGPTIRVTSDRGGCTQGEIMFAERDGEFLDSNKSEGEAKALVSETAEDGCKGIGSAEFTLLR